MEYDELVYACAVNRIFNYSCDKARDLVWRFSRPSEIFSLNRRELTDIFGKGSHFIDEILNPLQLERGREDVEWAYTHNVRIYYIQDSDYPWRLKECPDAPVVLYFRGNGDMNSARVISIVGSRKMTDYGKRACEEILESLAELESPPLIVSGLAYGVDITAHKAALRLGLPTIGAMATGLDTIYPTFHRSVAAQMLDCGGVVSDFPPKTSPVAINFIRRNRIIAGLADATILIESTKDGGGMITAKMARSYDREVFAVPGGIYDKLSEGCNLLIKESYAEMVTGKNSVRSSLGWKNISKDRNMRAKFLIFESDNECKKGIVGVLYEHKKATVDDLLDRTGFGRGELMTNITELELEGRIESDLIGYFTLKI